MTHTPGPWKMNTNVQTSIDAETKHIAMVNYYKSGRANDDVYGEEHEANARLIAAAPDLLEALKRIEIIGRGARPNISKGTIAGDIARAAIAKAEGKS